MEALRIRVVVRVLGAIPCGWGWICGGVGGRVLFSESPPLMRKDSGENPLLNGLKMVRTVVCSWWVGLIIVCFGLLDSGFAKWPVVG